MCHLVSSADLSWEEHLLFTKLFNNIQGMLSKRPLLSPSPRHKENANNLLLTFIRHMLAWSIALNAHRDVQKKRWHCPKNQSSLIWCAKGWSTDRVQTVLYVMSVQRWVLGGNSTKLAHLR